MVFKEINADYDANYESIVDIDCSSLSPMISMPHTVDNTCPVDKIGKVKIDQVLIGTCTNGRLSDLRIAADILNDKKIANGVELLLFLLQERFI